MTAPRVRQKKMDLLLCDAETLPTLPGVAHRLLPIVMTDPLPARHLQQAIESDAALAARAVLLALRHGHSAKGLTSVDAAFRAVPSETLATDFLSVRIASRESLDRAFFARLWRHNLAVGIASQIIATRLGTVLVEDALLAGILHDIGQLVLAAKLPLAYSQVLELVEAEAVDALEAERRVLGLDHAVLGRRLAQHWGFPESLQNVIWLHHQAEMPIPEGSQAETLARVVHLADLLARQAGFSYHPADAIRENTADVAARLGLSAAHADLISRQIVAGVRLNVGPSGADDTPTPDQMCDLIADANARLGRLYAISAARQHSLESQNRRADLTVQLTARLAECRSTREVLLAAAGVVREAVDARIVVPYVIGSEGEYIEGLAWTAGKSTDEPFFYEIRQERSLESLPAEGWAGPGAAGEVSRAERIEGWLFERMGPRLGDGPFYTVPMTLEGRKTGGFVFALANPAHHPTRTQAGDLASVAGIAATAVKRAQAETDLNALSEDLAEATRELELAQEARLEQRNVTSLGEMAAGASHEINNPLAIISGRAQQLALDEEDPARREMLATIVNQVVRITDILAELNEFARPAKPDLRPADLAALTAEVAAGFRPGADKPAARLRVETPAGCPRVRIDPGQVAEALREIVQNAFEACTDNHTITLSVQPVAGRQAVRLTVADDGPGMDPPTRARALNPFYSSREAGRRRGLGLPKAYRLVQASGGSMALESAPGHGTTVRLTFRAIFEESIPEKLLAEADPSDNRSGRKGDA